jgi:NAD(P)-dependent dehydrogenase (short-subunit alcohol dehydrogenase family)
MSDGADFPGGVALVVGGSGGIGQSICVALAEAGCDVVLTYRSNKEAAERVARKVSELGRSGSIFGLDLADSEHVHRTIASIVDAHKDLHTVVYAAGPGIEMRFVSELDDDQWQKALAVDGHGFFSLVRATLPHLRASGGSIVAITSAGLARYPARDVLSVGPKAAVTALVHAVAHEEGRFGVRANAVALGVIEAGMFERLAGKELDQRWLDAARDNIALKRFGRASEVADAVVYLASKRASYVTGQTLWLDGGYHI